jgi:CheY-like chemotaxis protein
MGGSMPAPGAGSALLVSQDRVSVLIVGGLLQSASYAPVAVTSGTEAVRVVKSRPVSLILAAQDCVPVSGLALHGLLAQDATHRSIPFVLMLCQEARRMLQARHAQLPAMLVPPFDRHGLERAIARARDPSLPDDSMVLEI